ncbi:MAG: quinone oxidoreductase [Gammaproteobacteria bacterium]|nr:quinone oxidoreductase [Gammaproteobacteria bacterium]
MPQAIRIQEPGGPEVMSLGSAPDAVPGPGEALVRVEAAGVNFIDTYHRTGLYPIPLPFTPGVEGAGVVEAVGEGVSDLAPGDRVGWVMQMGSYAEAAVRPAAKLVRLPDGVSTTQAAAALLQGMTAHYLVRSTFRVQSGMPVLVHAAAGGMGLLLCQMCRALGARVFGTVSTEAKAKAALAAGADTVIRYTEQDFAEVIRDELGDEKLAVAYDSVGETTWRKSMSLLRPRGMLVLYGQSSGPVPPIDPLLLSQHGSLFVTRPTLGDYAATTDELRWRAGEVLDSVASGKLQLTIDRELPLAQAAEAHRLLEGRATMGKLILRP